MSWFTELLVSLAATIYVVGTAKAHISAAISSQAERIIKQVASLHEDAVERIREGFELWWLGAEDQITPRIGEVLPIPSGTPDELKEVFVGKAAQQCKADAFHLAVNANIGKREGDLFSKLPRLGGIQERWQREQEAHQRELNDARLRLADLGVDIDELERTFAA